MDKHLIQVMLAFGVLLIISVFASKTTSRFGIPSLLIFIVVGMIGGPEGLGGIQFNDFHVTKNLGIIALSYILFSGGFSTQFQKVRPIWKEGITLAIFGVVISTAVMAALIHFIMGWTWATSALLGATMSCTDAAAVFSILRTRHLQLKEKLQSVLELESGSNDPIAIFLTISFIQIITSPVNFSGEDLVLNFFIQMAVGGFMGLVLGKLLAKFINAINLEFEGLYPVLTIAGVITIYSVTEYCQGNGFLSVYMAGMAMGGERFYSKKSLGVFHDGLAWLMQVAMFLSLGLLVNPSELVPIIIPGFIMATGLMLLARPLSTLVSLAPFKYKMSEILFISWGGLRGAVPIILATFSLVGGIPESRMIFNLVFFVVIMSTLIQGTSMGFMARMLRVKDEVAPKEGPIFKSRRPGKDFIEYIVDLSSPLVGHCVFALPLPNDVIVVLIHRGEEEIIPNAKTYFEPLDRVVCLVGEKTIPRLDRLMNSKAWDHFDDTAH
jgi:cell volume regulation protein A